MQEALVITRQASGWGFSPAPALPLAALLIGKPADEAARLLPRLFNLCAGAQDLGARLAMGLPALPDERLRQEIRRDHLLKLCVVWPRFFGLEPLPVPQDMARLSPMIVPQNAEEFPAWIRAEQGVAKVLGRIAQSFAKGEACADLPLFCAERAFAAVAQDNSVAARNADAPALRAIAAEHGRGPFWRAAALVFDLLALREAVPAPQICADGTVVVAAARGAYALRAEVTRGRVTGFARRTPTDHLCAPGGVLQRALATLPVSKAALLPLVVDILAPCVALRLPEVHHA
jgi:hypothetical protein